MSRKICKKRTALHCDNGVIRCDDVDIWWYLSGWWRDLDTSFSVQLIWNLDCFPNLLLSWSWQNFIPQAPGKTSGYQVPLFSLRHVNNGEALLHQVVLQKYINVVLVIQLSGLPKKSMAGIYALHEAGKPGKTACLSRLSCLIWKIWWSYRLLWWINACMLQMSRPNSQRSSFCGYNKFSND